MGLTGDHTEGSNHPFQGLSGAVSGGGAGGLVGGPNLEVLAESLGKRGASRLTGLQHLRGGLEFDPQRLKAKTVSGISQFGLDHVHRFAAPAIGTKYPRQCGAGHSGEHNAEGGLDLDRRMARQRWGSDDQSIRLV